MSRPINIAVCALSASVCAVCAYAALPRPHVSQTPVPVPVPSASPTPAPPPLLTIPDAPKDAHPVAIERADILFQSVGALTKTTVTLRFRNTTDRILEGELAFPLPEGAALSGYALDVNGEMADAVPVPKETARVVFETEARKGIDPGLVEQTQGNNFRTRIYPLPAKGTRTVRLSFVSELTTNTAGESSIAVPLRWNQTVPLVSVNVESDAPATLSVGGKDRDMVEGKTSGSRSRTLENIAINGDMTIRVQTGKSQALQNGVMVENFVKPSSDVGTYFAVLEQTPVPKITAPVVRSGRTVALLWDASLSRRSADIERELRFLQTIAREKWRDTSVRVFVLRNKIESGGTFQITDGDTTALVAFLRKQPLDGGTARFDLRTVGMSDSGALPEYVLAFTDGLETVGSNIGAMRSSTPIFFVNTDSRNDATRLRAVASVSGGDFVNLSGDATSDAERAKTIGEAPYSLLSATVDTGDVEGWTVAGVSPVKAANGVAFAGRLVSDTATLTLRYGYPGKVTATRTVTVRKPEPTVPSSGLVASVWAQRTADALGVDPTRNRDALRQIGQDFGIVTPGTSLLVLESLDQCLQYGIAPARSRKALYAQYIGVVETRGVARKREERSRLEQTVARWDKRVAHWRTEFKPAPNFRYKSREEEADGVSGGGLGVGNGAATAGSFGGRASAAAAASPPRATNTAAPRPVTVQGRSSGGADRETRRVAAPSAGALMADSAAKETKSDDAAPVTPVATIAIKPWSPDAPYIKAMAAAKTPDDAYAVYLAERKSWLETPAYYFDCAEELHRRNADDLAVRVLTGIADLRQEDAALLRIVAHRLVQWNHVGDAVPLFEQIAELRPEEPQSFRDLALALADRGDSLALTAPDKAVADYNRALTLFNKVAVGNWDRFAGISDIAVTEANRVIARAKRLPASAAAKLIVPLDARLVRNLDCDLRVVMTWDSDNSDMDLHIMEPTGEECFYSHNTTVIGGRMSDDFTQGYGPEEYFVRRNIGGDYRISTNYFGSREQKITGGTTVQATVYTNFGRANETKQSLSLRLTANKETVVIGNVTVAKGSNK